MQFPENRGFYREFRAFELLGCPIEAGKTGVPPERVAAVILAAAKDNSDRLRYAATDALPALRMLRLSPGWAGRKMLSKGFGLK
jgi:hypothetical protein